jgi:hypothetical protein
VIEKNEHFSHIDIGSDFQARTMPKPNAPEPGHDGPSRTCECGKQMTHLGSLPQSKGKPAIDIFRCYSCDNVISEPK